METNLRMNPTMPPAERIVILETCPSQVVRMPLAIQRPAQAVLRSATVSRSSA